MPQPRILVIDDDPIIHTICMQGLVPQGYDVASALRSEEGLSQLATEFFDVVLLDLKMPDLDGLEVLRRIRQGEDPDLSVVIITGKATVPVAVDSLRLGADDFLTKPFDIDELATVLQRVLELTKLRRELRQARRWQREQFGLKNVIGQSPAMQAVYAQVHRIAASPNATVLIRGETGTGKGLLARAIHYHSPRADKPFVELNCAAIPESLVEVELFGCEKGAFTDAYEARLGHLEMAEQGTLFLDEIGSMSRATQAKVLNVLEEKTFRRVGGREALRVDVRLIVATNRDLEQAVAEGAFGADLYYRLNVLPLTLPPLRERGEDITLLARHFLDQLTREMGKKSRHLTPAAEAKLLAHPWPGNVRELRNVIERTVLLTDAETIDAEDLLLSPPAGSQLVLNVSPLAPLEAVERAYCLQVLERCGGNRTHAADRLGIDRKTLQRKLKEWGFAESSD